MFKKKKPVEEPKKDAEDMTVRINTSNVAPLQMRGLFPDSIRGRVFEITEAGGTIGSLADSTICLQDSQKSVSRTHCRILYSSTDGSFHIADLNSSNGTSLTTDKSTFKMAPQTFFVLRSGFIVHIGVEVQLIVAEGAPGSGAAPGMMGGMPGGGMPGGGMPGGGMPGGGMAPGGGYPGYGPAPGMGGGGMPAPGYPSYGSGVAAGGFASGGYNPNTGSASYAPAPAPYGSGAGSPAAYNPSMGSYGAPNPNSFGAPPPVPNPNSFGPPPPVPGSYAPPAAAYPSYGTGGYIPPPADIDSEVLAAMEDFGIGSSEPTPMPITYTTTPYAPAATSSPSASVGSPAGAAAGGGGASVKAYYNKEDGSKPLVTRINVNSYADVNALKAAVLNAFNLKEGVVKYKDNENDELEIVAGTAIEDVRQFAQSIQIYPQKPALPPKPVARGKR